MRSTLDRDATLSFSGPVEVAAGPGGSSTPRQPLGLRGPWSRRDAVAPGILAALGVAGVGLCWFRASGEIDWRDQLDDVKFGALCASLFVIACAGYLLMGVRRVRAEINGLRARRQRLYGLPAAEVAAAISASVGAPGALVSAASMTRVHKPDCLLMRGKQPVVVTAEQAAAYARCGVCDG